MRAIAILPTLVIVAVWAVIRYPHTEANADAIVDRPVARLQEVRSISLDGDNLPLSRLREVIETRPGEQLHTERLGRDRQAMERVLASLGYLAARVDPAVALHAPRQGSLQIGWQCAGVPPGLFPVAPPGHGAGNG